MGCSLEDDVTSGPAAACDARHHHHLGLQRDQDELMLLCDERVDEDESNEGVVAENTSSSASSSRDDVNLSSRHDEAAIGDDSHSNTATALLLNQDIGVRVHQQQPVEDEHKDERKDQQQSLYALRRNPKRSQRFIDEEFALEISAGPTPAVPKSSTARGPSIFNEKARACTECGKEFSSWKALFGHMRCHPEREWRGIQKPVSIHQLAAKSGLKRSSSKSAKSRSQGQTATMSAMSFQDRAASGLFKVITSDDESDTESIEAAYMNGGGFFSSKSDSNGPRAMAVAAGKITGKRSKRQRTIFLQQEAASGDMKEERDMANCLVMLASAGQKSSEEEQDVSSGTIEPENEDEDQLAEEFNYSGGELEEEKQNSMLIAVRGSPGDGNSNSPVMTLFEGSTAIATTSRNLFVEEPGLFGGGELLEHMKYECATCKRIFKSHQALGGHRASHKKVKGCFARTNSDGVQQQQQQQTGDDEMTMMVSEDELLLRSDEQLDLQDHYHGHIVPVFVSPTLAATASASHHRGHLNFAGFKDDISGNAGYGFNRKQLMKAHECSICHRVFTSGQALGGHKRCHWGGTVDRGGAESQEASAAAAGDNRSSSSSSKMVLHGETTNLVFPQKDELLDLNLPPARGQAGEDQLEVEIVAASFRREFQQETKTVRKPDTESAAAAGGCAFDQLPRLVPAYTLVKRKKEAAVPAAKLATKKNSGALNGLHQLGLGQTTMAASMTTTATTTMAMTKRAVQAPASAG